jgi:hypothetical protein
MFCSKCGEDMPDGSRYCPECGAQQSGSVSPPPPGPGGNNGKREPWGQDDLVHPKNPPLSPHLALLSLVVVGLPQLIFGQTSKGIVCFVAFWLSFNSPGPVGAVLPAIMLVASVIDAYMVGMTLKVGVPVKKWDFFPKP